MQLLCVGDDYGDSSETELLNSKTVRNDGPVISDCLSKISIRDSTCKTCKFLHLFSIYSILSNKPENYRFTGLYELSLCIML